MEHKPIHITEQIKEAINEFLGAELIPACAVGGQLCYVDGNLILKTFRMGKYEGYRKLENTGQLVNIIMESAAE